MFFFFPLCQACIDLGHAWVQPRRGQRSGSHILPQTLHVGTEITLVTCSRGKVRMVFPSYSDEEINFTTNTSRFNSVPISIELGRIYKPGSKSPYCPSRLITFTLRHEALDHYDILKVSAEASCFPYICLKVNRHFLS